MQIRKAKRTAIKGNSMLVRLSSSTVSYFTPPRLKRNLRTWMESLKWPGAFRMMFEKQVMELSSLSLTTKQPRDNLLATEAEGTLQKTMEANSSQYHK